MARRGSLRTGPEFPRRPAPEIPPRRPALRQRRDPHGHPAQQGAQGHRGAIADDGRLRQPLRARLGLSRPADRAQGGQGPGLEGGEHEPRRDPGPLPHRGHEVGRGPAQPVPPARCPGRLGAPLPDARPALRGGHPRRPVGLDRTGLRQPTAQADPLVHHRSHRAGGGRVGIPGGDHTQHLRQFPDGVGRAGGLGAGG